jgi:hypothetical protein
MSPVINESSARTSQLYMFVFDCSDVCLHGSEARQKVLEPLHLQSPELEMGVSFYVTYGP